MDPVVLFFILGLVATLLKSEIKIPEAFYNVLSIYLLLAIGIKGGIELYNSNLQSLVLPAIGTILLGVITTLVAYFILSHLKNLTRLMQLPLPHIMVL
jgi:uncharacterized protein